MSASMYAIFVPTFFFVSITPGLCMTLAMTLGMTIGVRRTLWMMLGELVGVALVVLLTVAGVAALMLQNPNLFIALKWMGGAYLFYLGIQLWRSKGKLSLSTDTIDKVHTGRVQLISQGFITAVANPKGWAFFIALLPPFIAPDQPLAEQLTLMVLLILGLEFVCLVAYASGGKALSTYLKSRGNVRLINRIAGTLMLGVSVWLAAG